MALVSTEVVVAQITLTGFASLMLGISLALMLCGLVIFFIGFLLMLSGFDHGFLCSRDRHHDFHAGSLSSLLLHVTTHSKLRKKDGQN